MNKDDIKRIQDVAGVKPLNESYDSETDDYAKSNYAREVTSESNEMKKFLDNISSDALSAIEKELKSGGNSFDEFLYEIKNKYTEGSFDEVFAYFQDAFDNPDEDYHSYG
jgi:hypothetical protein